MCFTVRVIAKSIFERRPVMKSKKQNLIWKHICRIFLCLSVSISFLGTGLTAKAAEADSNDRGHTHVFNQHFDQNAGYTVSDPHQFVYGYNAGGEPVLKTCNSYLVHTYYRVGCSCGTYKPDEPTHDHKSRKQHPWTSDPSDCKLGTVYIPLPSDCLY